ncbi:MAG: MATE family efflux transporter [Burkholderiaceae bacterium]
MSYTQTLTTAPVLPTIVRMSLPNMMAMVATTMVSIVETSYVGQLGMPALAGIALVFPMVMLQHMLSAGSIGGGVSSAISRALGAGDMAKANSLAWHATVISAVLGLAFTLLFLLAGHGIFSLAGGAGDTLQQALAYSNVAFGGVMSLWLLNAFASILRAAGNMKTPSNTLLLAAVGQIALGGAFGLGIGPFPRLGMAGVALGMVFAFTAGGLYLFWHLWSGRDRVRLRFNHPLRAEYFTDILKVGGVSSLSSVQTVLTILILTRIMAGFGTEALAGYGIGARLEFMIIPVCFAIGVACLPLVGMSLGANLVSRAREVAWTGAGLSAAALGTVGLLVVLFPTAWTSLFTTDPQVTAYASDYFRWVGPFYCMFGLGLCLYFSAQGAGKLLGPVLAGTARLLLVAIGGWYLLSKGAPATAMFALIGAAMLVYGGVTALSVYWTRWER